MLRQGLKTLIESPLAHGGTDTVMNGLGISAAVLSASFAGYMAMSGPTLSGRATHSVETAAPAEQGAEAGRVGRASHGAGMTAGDPDIDFTPTGSVAMEDAERQPGEDAPDASRSSLRDFAVRDVFDGTALIEARGSLQLVKPGTLLEGAGTVVSIEKRGSSLRVVTTEGVIKQRP